MKRSDQPTNFVYILAETASAWDTCDFAIIQLTGEWRSQMRDRLTLLNRVDTDNSFCSLRYWDNFINFYRKDSDEETDLTDSLLKDGETWCFIALENGELDRFLSPENTLGTSMISIYQHGTAIYSSCGKNTGEEFWTEAFNLEQLTETNINVKPGN